MRHLCSKHPNQFAQIEFGYSSLSARHTYPRPNINCNTKRGAQENKLLILLKDDVAAGLVKLWKNPKLDTGRDTGKLYSETSLGNLSEL